MKMWVRIVIALSVVVVVGFVLWAFFFREKDEVVAYNAMTEMVEYQESIGLKERLIELNSMNYLNNDKSALISAENTYGADILEIREMCLTPEVIYKYNEHGIVDAIYDSYYTYDLMTKEVFKDILPYLNGNKTNRKAQKTLTKSINNYINTLKRVSADLDLILENQAKTTGEGSSYAQLKGNYTSFKSNYREMLGYDGQIITSSINYINQAVYNNNFKADTSFALYDCFGRSLVSFEESNIHQEIYFSNNIHIISEKIGKVEADQSIYSEKYTELDFLQSYNLLLIEHNNVLNDVFDEQFYKICEMADGNSLSGIVDEAKSPLVKVLNVLGF